MSCPLTTRATKRGDEDIGPRAPSRIGRGGGPPPDRRETERPPAYLSVLPTSKDESERIPRLTSKRATGEGRGCPQHAQFLGNQGYAADKPAKQEWR